MAYGPAELERIAQQIASREGAATGVRGLVVIGVDHRTASLELRERLALAPEEERALLHRLTDDDAISEAAMIATCNRSELYVHATDPGAAFRLAFDRAFLDQAPEVGDEGRFYVKHDSEAARHLIQVACGLESMVLGEPEILGQVKQSVARARDHGLASGVLDRLFRTAIRAGGRARKETEIGAGAVSFGYAVVELARSIFSRLDRVDALVIGAGETGRQVARSLSERGARTVRVANRGRARAEALKDALPDVELVDFDSRDATLAGSDVVVTTTGAQEPLVRRHSVAQAMAQRRGRALLAVDLGVPRNIEASVGKIDNVFLQDIDALEALIDRNLKRRRSEVPRVSEIVDAELARLQSLLGRSDADPILAAIQENAETLRRAELARLAGQIDADAFAEVDRVTSVIVRKMLHHPRRFLRGAEGDPTPHWETIRKLFGIDQK